MDPAAIAENWESVALKFHTVEKVGFRVFPPLQKVGHFFTFKSVYV